MHASKPVSAGHCFGATHPLGTAPMNTGQDRLHRASTLLKVTESEVSHKGKQEANV